MLLLAALLLPLTWRCVVVPVQQEVVYFVLLCAAAFDANGQVDFFDYLDFATTAGAEPAKPSRADLRLVRWTSNEYASARSRESPKVKFRRSHRSGPRTNKQVPRNLHAFDR